MQERLEQRHQRITERFDRVRAQIEKKYDAPNINQQRIIDAALELLDEDGLNNLSLRKLAARLDMQAPALYWHFKNKEVLIDYMAEAILQSEFKELNARKPEEPWQDWLISICVRLRNAVRAHRDGARVVAGAHLYPAVTLMKLFEVSMESLTSAGLELQRANLIITTASHFAFGTVIEEQAAPTPGQIEDFMASDMLEDYPLMAKSIQLSMHQARGGYDEFEDALRLIVGYAEK